MLPVYYTSFALEHRNPVLNHGVDETSVDHFDVWVSGRSRHRMEQIFNHVPNEGIVHRRVANMDTVDVRCVSLVQCSDRGCS